jgi:hypothetical protein
MSRKMVPQMLGMWHNLETRALTTVMKAPKPERAHHCSLCGRCVLKMGMYAHVFVSFLVFKSSCLDHHCPWLGSKCIVSYCILVPIILRRKIITYHSGPPYLPSISSLSLFCVMFRYLYRSCKHSCVHVCISKSI